MLSRFLIMKRKRQQEPQEQQDSDREETHEADCGDANCAGCAEGEIEFDEETREMSTLELMQVANRENDIRVKEKLLEFALEKFEAQKLSHSNDADFWMRWGDCLSHLGQLVGMGEFVESAIEKYLFVEGELDFQKRDIYVRLCKTYLLAVGESEVFVTIPVSFRP